MYSTLKALVLVFLTIALLKACGHMATQPDDEVTTEALSSVSTDGTVSSGNAKTSGSSSSSASTGNNKSSAIGTVGSSSSSLTNLAYGGQTYKTVRIGKMVWMSENLNIGTQIAGAPSGPNQSNDKIIEKFCYDDKAELCKSEGALYQWAEAMGLPDSCNTANCASQINSGHHRGICPGGWHIPKPAEWQALINALGGDSALVGEHMKLRTTLFAEWSDAQRNDGNSSAFAAWPAGGRHPEQGYVERGLSADFWQAAQTNATYAPLRSLKSVCTYLHMADHRKTYGFSVRCVQDE